MCCVLRLSLKDHNSSRTDGELTGFHTFPDVTNPAELGRLLREGGTRYSNKLRTVILPPL